MTSSAGDREHTFSEIGVCSACGHSREYAARHHPTCAGPPLTPEPAATARSASAPFRALTLPLAIVPSSNAAAGKVEVRLVSAAPDSVVIASEAGAAGEFDPDAAFRRLDDLRTHGDTVLAWVFEALLDGPELPRAAPEVEPREPLLPRIRRGAGKAGVWLLAQLWWVVGALAALGAVAGILRVPAGTIFTIGTWIYFGLSVVALIAAFSGGFLAVGGVVLLLLVILTVIRETGVAVGLTRVVLSVVAGVIFFLLAVLLSNETQARAKRALERKRPEARDPAESDPGEEPKEYVYHRREAVRYLPSLCVAGRRQRLSVCVECTDERGTVVRRVVFPVAEATRASAEAVARQAMLPDQRFKAERARKEAEALAAASAVERIAELERVRKSLAE